MGTVVSIAAYGQPGEPATVAETAAATAAATVAAVVDEAVEVLHRIDSMFTTWDPGSPMSLLRSGQMAWQDAPGEVDEVLSLCAEAKRVSKGWFDPWVMPGGVDPTGLVKGWALERAMDVLRRGGLGAAVINAGGDVATHGRPAPGERWRVGIRHPWRPASLACVVEVDGAVATSGTYERGPHLVDPFAGRPAARAASATVVGPELAMADALATALAVGGDHVLVAIADLAGYEAYLIRTDGSEAGTPGIRFAG